MSRYLKTLGLVNRAAHAQLGISVRACIRALQEDPTDREAFLRLSIVISELGGLGLDSSSLTTGITALLADDQFSYPPTKAWTDLVKMLACAGGVEACTAQCRRELAFGDDAGAIWYFSRIADQDLRKQLLQIAVERGDLALMQSAGIPALDQLAALTSRKASMQVYWFVTQHLDDADMTDAGKAYLAEQGEFGLLASVVGKQVKASYRQEPQRIALYAAELGKQIGQLPDAEDYVHEWYEGEIPETERVVRASVAILISHVAEVVRRPFGNTLFPKESPGELFEEHLLEAVGERGNFWYHLRLAQAKVGQETWTLHDVLERLTKPCTLREVDWFCSSFKGHLKMASPDLLKRVAARLQTCCADAELALNVPACLVPYVVSSKEEARALIALVLTRAGDEERSWKIPQQIALMLPLSLSRRMLLLYESVSLANDTVRNHMVEQVLHSYQSEETLSNFSRFAVPRYLLNDTDLFWRLMCTDYSGQTRAKEGKEWGLRSIKLNFSRKLLAFP